MTRRSFRRAAFAVAAAAALAAFAAAGAAARAGDRTLPPGTQFSVRVPDAAAVRQAERLDNQGHPADAALIRTMLTIPQATWVTKGSPVAARDAVREAVLRADRQHAVAVLVAYNIPGRDCGGLSAGGATNLADYEAWIDGFARGIGNKKAVVILEPDALGLLPSNCGAGFPFTDTDRYAELNYAVDRLEQQPSALVYLDATHPGWLDVGDASQRLLNAGVQRAQGFFLNVSNFQYTENDVFYGTWISDCIAYVTQITPGDFGGCPNQYWDGGPATNWTGDSLDTYQVWRDEPYSGNPADLKWNTVGIDSRWALVLGSVQPTTHFVVDTSRNGLGPWNWSAAGYPDAGTAQDWCNPPGRGLGPRPAAQPLSGNPLVDAYLWIKTPGESDGQCTRGTAGPADPIWGLVDPVAGAWFPQQALQLAQLAAPPLP